MAEYGKAVWSHPGRDYKQGKDAVGPMMQRLADAGFHLVIPCVKGHGRVSYQSKVAHVEAWCEGWDPLETMAREAEKAGLKLHPWFCVFPEGEGSALVENRPDLAARDSEGKAQEWACPRSQEVQDYEFALYEEVMAYDVAGVHMDYIRYGGGDSCHCHRCREAFSEAFGVETTRVHRRDALWGEWLLFRNEPVTRFVRRLRKATRQNGKELSVAVFPDYPGCIVGIGQDWGGWVEEGLVDLLVPMNYTPSTELARRKTQAHVAYAAGKVPVWEGLGKVSSHSHIPTRYLREQIDAVLEAGADGICVFSYAAMLEEDLALFKSS